MEPVLIYTDTNKTDAGAIRTFSLDMAFGSDEQNFEASFSEPQLSGGELLYIDGTEYGGIIDSVSQSTDTEVTTYKGRTWHGMLAGKIVKPPANQNYYTLSGEANTCIASLLSYVGLSSVLTARSESSGINVNSYQFDRFTNAYNGLLKMLASANAILRIERHDGITELWAETRATITDEADSDLLDFTVTDSIRVPNHLVCAGEGELKDRVVVDLYADASGNVSQTQTLTGVDEIAVLYTYNNADATELVKEGTKELQGYQQGGGADIAITSKGDWHVGDKLQVRDNRTGTVIVSTIAKKIVKVSGGVLTVDYEVGSASAQSYGGGASAETSLVTPIANGGTGASTAANARTNLDVPGLSTTNRFKDSNQYIKMTNVDSAQSNNGVSETAYNLFGVIDKNDKYLLFAQSLALNDGSVRAEFSARNYGTGSNVNNMVRLTVNNDGSRETYVSDPSGWRSAIGIGAWGFATAASDTTLTTTATKAAFTVFNGEGCSLSSNGIKVEQAGWYEISGSYEFRTNFTANDIIHIYIRNGSTDIAHTLWRTYSTTPYHTIAVAPFVAQLAANDVVYMYVYNQTGARGVARAQEVNGNGLYIKKLS